MDNYCVICYVIYEYCCGMSRGVFYPQILMVKWIFLGDRDGGEGGVAPGGMWG